MGCTFQETTDLGPVGSSSPLNVHVHDHDCIGIELRICNLSLFIKIIIATYLSTYTPASNNHG